jgi:hypothetical protein
MKKLGKETIRTSLQLPKKTQKKSAPGTFKCYKPEEKLETECSKSLLTTHHVLHEFIPKATGKICVMLNMLTFAWE